MRHLGRISALPARAQTEGDNGAAICNDINNDFQAQLCFFTELLINFFLPVFTLKASINPDAGR
jgi:hypothetical protein